MKQPLDFTPAQSRRVFIHGVGWIGASLFASTLGGCESLLEQIRNRPVRRRLRAGSPEVDAAVATYRQAVSAMKALPASNPRSWAAQAGIHGTVNGGFNFCQHGTDHFFSWHRAYLLYFERICQELTGNRQFGLPYWNWNSEPAIHSAFTDPTSSLFHPRNRTSVAGNSAFFTATLDPIFADTNFFTFGSQIEGTPHNTAHGLIGRDMGTGGSPLDPIFWAHHCMVDYCWAKWNLELGNNNPNNATWTGTSWNHFVDGAGNPVNVTAGATVLMPLLSYRYESSAIGSSPAERRALSRRDLRTLEDRIRRGADIRLDIRHRIPIQERAVFNIARTVTTPEALPTRDFSTILQSDSAREQVFVRIAYAKHPPASDFFVRVFLNLPTASSQTPTTDPHYAGSFAFFGVETPGHAGHHKAPEFLVNITPTLQRLVRTGQVRPGATVSVQLVAVPMDEDFAKRDADLELESIELIVTPVIVRQQ